jgi:hypothetical protein
VHWKLLYRREDSKGIYFLRDYIRRQKGDQSFGKLPEMDKFQDSEQRKVKNQ